MNISMTRAEYDALEDRQTMTGLPVPRRNYRDSAHPDTVFECKAGNETLNGPGYHWWAYRIDFSDPRDRVPRSFP